MITHDLNAGKKRAAAQDEFRREVLAAMGDEWISSSKIAKAIDSKPGSVGGVLYWLMQNGYVEKLERENTSRLTRWRKIKEMSEASGRKVVAGIEVERVEVWAADFPMGQDPNMASVTLPKMPWVDA